MIKKAKKKSASRIVVPAKTLRVRDPIHDLIVFRSKCPLDQLAWRLVNTREFQRLRRIKQLGFSEITYPGASHSRLSHSIGVFHTARELVSIIEAKFARRSDERRIACLCAALLHDIGHGPFSHVFEGVAKSIGNKKNHESWSSEIILGDTEVNKQLRSFDSGLPDKVAKIVASDDPEDIFASIISSQFDADRMDYLRRDRYMCGVSVGYFDYDWLLENLIKARVVKYADPDRRIAEQIDWIVLDPKAREAAEGYLLARYQLYSTIYYHKTTRSAEGMLRIFLKRVVDKIRSRKLTALGVGPAHPIVNFFSKEDPTADDYIRMDDSSMWSLLSDLAYSKDEFLSDLAQRILSRRLFKSFDIGARTTEAHGDRSETFLFELKQSLHKLGLVNEETFFEDHPKAKGYDWYEWDAPSALKKVLIRDKEHNENIDIATTSGVVNSLKARNFLRVYATDSGSINRIESLWNRQGGTRK